MACYLYHSKETLPINELKRITTEGGCADLNLHRCINLKCLLHRPILTASYQLYNSINLLYGTINLLQKNVSNAAFINNIQQIIFTIDAIQF